MSASEIIIDPLEENDNNSSNNNNEVMRERSLSSTLD